VTSDLDGLVVFLQIQKPPFPYILTKKKNCEIKEEIELAMERKIEEDSYPPILSTPFTYDHFIRGMESFLISSFMMH
jgi:phosphoribosyl 1,2-cyclic phosphodiesterase